ncbi:MAG: hypothetical protein O2826_12965 [Chloroflexi bacterium]|nr:hypothetical protein [Chloroflexota bacterium]MDA1175410.1 hypothetical protein [Chloroflexota bacterium]
MVMSQAAIDALMTQNASEQDEAEDDELDAIVLAEDNDTTAAAPVAAEAEATPAASADVDPLGDDPAIEEPLGALTEEELAAVKALAADDSLPVADPPQTIEAGEESEDAAGVKMRRWSASSTSANDPIKERVQDLEDKLTLLESNGIGAQPAESVDPQQLVELKQTLDALTASVQGIAATLQQLTEASQASLGFAAKQTFDCPECQSHGTVSVPITCTYCGFESEWGFYPEQ